MTNRKARRPYYALSALAAFILAPACGAEDGGDPRHYEDDLGTVYQELPKGTAGAENGQGNYCTGGDLCNLGEGDCDRDSECAGTLVCGYDNLIQYLSTAKNGTDACTAPHCRSGHQNADETGVDCGGADCGACLGCPTAPDGDANHCTQDCPCPAGEADCDTNADCAGALVCGQDLGPQFGYPNGHDVCVASHCTNGMNDADETGVDCGGADCGACQTCPANGLANTCSPTCPCASGWGDCDGNSQCQAGLVCANDMGGQFGMNATFEVCVPPHCDNNVQDSGDGETGVDCGGPCGTCQSASSPSTSCEAGDQNLCGAAGTENCCAVGQVPGATFIRNYDGVLLTSSGGKSATVSTFYLDKFEVTVGRFRKFVEDFDTWVGGGNPTAGAGTHAGTGWDASWPLAADAATLTSNLSCAAAGTWTGSAGANEARPMTCMNWYEAFAFCIWDGGYLPTESEHNFAASGGAQQRVYPWSSPATSTALDYTQSQYNCGGDGCSGTSENLVVGSLPAGAARWGHMDLSGNVWEFTLDVWSDTLPSPCSNCSYQSGGVPWHVIRGGSWATSAVERVTAGWRDRGSTDGRLQYVGFRCARN